MPDQEYITLRIPKFKTGSTSNIATNILGIILSSSWYLDHNGFAIPTTKEEVKSLAYSLLVAALAYFIGKK